MFKTKITNTEINTVLEIRVTTLEIFSSYEPRN